MRSACHSSYVAAISLAARSRSQKESDKSKQRPVGWWESREAREREHYGDQGRRRRGNGVVAWRGVAWRGGESRSLARQDHQMPRP